MRICRRRFQWHLMGSGWRPHTTSFLQDPIAEMGMKAFPKPLRALQSHYISLHYLLWCNMWLKYCQTPRVYLSGEQTLRDSLPEDLNLDSPYPCEEPHGMGRIPVHASPALDGRILQPSTSPARKMLAGFVSLITTQRVYIAC